MPCNIDNCSSSDDRFMWQCYGSCGRKFHAACAGTQRNSEERIRRFMLPLCYDCQEKFSFEISLKTLLQQQHALKGSMEAILETNHKICSNLNSFSMPEAFDSLELLLNELRGELGGINKKNDTTAANLLNKVSSLLSDTNTAETVTSTVQQASTGLSSLITNKLDDATKIIAAHCMSSRDQQFFEEIINLKADLKDSIASMGFKLDSFLSASSATNSSNAILDELKALAIALSDIGDTSSFPVAKTPSDEDEMSLALSLADELEAAMNDEAVDEIQSITNDEAVDYSGWRFLGSVKTWKADWRSYDRKLQVRLEQEKTASKARRRKLKFKNNHLKEHNKKSKNHNYTPRHGIQQHGDQSRTNSCKIPGRRVTFLNNSVSIINDGTPLGTSNNKVHLSDREMLAAAKVQFAGPPKKTPPTKRFIEFQNGGIINSYNGRQRIAATPQENTALIPSSDSCCCYHSNFFRKFDAGTNVLY